MDKTKELTLEEFLTFPLKKIEAILDVYQAYKIDVEKSVLYLEQLWNEKGKSDKEYKFYLENISFDTRILLYLSALVKKNGCPYCGKPLD